MLDLATMRPYSTKYSGFFDQVALLSLLTFLASQKELACNHSKWPMAISKLPRAWALASLALRNTLQTEALEEAWQKQEINIKESSKPHG
jgi:hypothetical protein